MKYNGNERKLQELKEMKGIHEELKEMKRNTGNAKGNT